MATERDDDTGQFKSKPQEGGGLSQADADALEKGDVAEVNKDSDPRLAMMEKARVTRAEEMGAEIDKEKDDAEEPGAKREEPKEGDAGAEGGTGTGTSSEPAPVALEDTAVVELLVNGKPEKMSWAEAKKQLQLGKATEETLKQAKESREAANRELEAAAAVRKVMGEAPAAKEEPKGPTDAEKRATALKAAEDTKRTARRDYAKAAQYGTEKEVEDATAALEKAEDEVDKLRFETFKDSAPAVEHRDQLLDREVADTNRGTKTYLEDFSKDHQDPLFRAAAALYLREENIADLTKLGADESVLRKLTDQELGEHHFRARSRGLVRSVDKVLTAAGTRAREELTKRSTPATPAGNPRDERQIKKEGAPSQPKAAAGRIPEPEAQQRPTGRDLVAEAKARRGKG